MNRKKSYITKYLLLAQFCDIECDIISSGSKNHKFSISTNTVFSNTPNRKGTFLITFMVTLLSVESNTTVVFKEKCLLVNITPFFT